MQRRSFTREQKQKCGLKCSAKRDSGCLVSVKIRIFRAISVSNDIVARVCAYRDGFFKCTQPRTNGLSLTGAQNVSDNKPNVRKSYGFAYILGRWGGARWSLFCKNSRPPPV